MASFSLLTTLIALSLLLQPSISTTTILSDTPLNPWEISTLRTFTPSGRPGNAPYASLFLTISNPNTISFDTPHARNGGGTFPPSSANCTIRWNAFTEEPYGRDTPCCNAASFTDGRWTVQMQKATNATAGYDGPSSSSSPTADFKLLFVLEQSMLMDNGAIISKIFVGERVFSVGKDLSIVCGGSGVCNTWLKEDKVAVVQQRLWETKCLLGVCDDV